MIAKSHLTSNSKMSEDPLSNTLQALLDDLGLRGADSTSLSLAREIVASGHEQYQSEVTTENYLEKRRLPEAHHDDWEELWLTKSRQSRQIKI